MSAETYVSLAVQLFDAEGQLYLGPPIKSVSVVAASGNAMQIEVTTVTARKEAPWPREALVLLEGVRLKRIRFVPGTVPDTVGKGEQMKLTLDLEFNG